MSLRELSQSRFVRQAAVLISGTLLAQGLVILTSPVMTRIYAPAALGLAAVFTSVINLLSKSSAAYQLAVPIPTEDGEAVTLLQIALLLLALASVIATVVIGAAWFLLPNYAWTGSLGEFVWLVPLGVLCYGAFKVLSYWPIRKQNYRLASVARFSQAGFLVAVQIVIGLLIGWTGGMIAGVIVGAGMGVVALWRLKGNQSGQSLMAFDMRNIKDVAVRYKRFPILTALPMTFESLSSDLPVILFAVFFDAQVAGFFALSTRVLSVPASLLAETLERVFMGEASVRIRESLASVRRLQIRMVLGMAAICLPFVLLLVFTGPALFGWVFGPEWREAGIYVQLLAPMYLFLVIASPTQSTLAIVQRPALQIPRVLFHFIMPLALLIAKWLNVAPREAVLMLSGAGVLNYLAYLVLAFVAVGQRKYAVTPTA